MSHFTQERALRLPLSGPNHRPPADHLHLNERTSRVLPLEQLPGPYAGHFETRAGLARKRKSLDRALQAGLRPRLLSKQTCYIAYPRKSGHLRVLAIVRVHTSTGTI